MSAGKDASNNQPAALAASGANNQLANEGVPGATGAGAAEELANLRHAIKYLNLSLERRLFPSLSLHQRHEGHELFEEAPHYWDITGLETKIEQLSQKNLGLAGEVHELVVERERVGVEMQQLVNERQRVGDEVQRLLDERQRVVNDVQQLIDEHRGVVWENHRLVNDMLLLFGEHQRVVHERDQLARERDQLARERDQLARERDQLVGEKQNADIVAESMRWSIAKLAKEVHERGGKWEMPSWVPRDEVE